MTQYDGGNTTGFVSPAGDHLEQRIDLSSVLDLNQPSRYPVRVAGDALTSRGILHGDILIADAALPLLPGRVAIVMQDGAVLVAQLTMRNGLWWLQSGRPGATIIPLSEDAEVWAVVTGLVRSPV